MNDGNTFADRCQSALAAVYPELANDPNARRIIAGAWDAFEQFRFQHSPEGLIARANGIPPPRDAVAAYLKEIGYGIDPDKFMDFYSQKGWLVGRGSQKMKDWRAACRNWKREGWGQGQAAQGPRPPVASLGALQIQLEKVKQETRHILNPGGSAWNKTASQLRPDELARLERLNAMRASLEKQIEGFGT